MAVTSQDFLSLAKELSTRQEEICWRGAVSRAYYCIYHECQFLREKLPEAPYDSDPKGIHDRFIKQFTTYTGNDELSRGIRAIGYILATFKDIRTEADYEIEHSFRQRTVQEAFQYVENIRKKLQQLENLQQHS